MGSDVWFTLLLIGFLILVNGFFAAAEIAVVSIRKSRLQQLLDEGHLRAHLVQKLKADPESFLATIQIGITFASTLGAAIGGSIAVDVFGPTMERMGIQWILASKVTIALVVFALLQTFLEIVIGELVPKSLALRYAEPIALNLGRIVYYFSRSIHWVVRLLTAASNLVLKPFGDSTTFTESKISEEEFKLMLEEGTKTGVIEKTEHELFKNIFEFSDKTVREVMVPRTSLVAVNADRPVDEIVKYVLEEGYSRMPVYRSSIDNIIGVVHSKDMLALIEHRSFIVFDDVVRPAYFVPETKHISKLMREFQLKQKHIAIVVDEFGGTAGIVTMEDILEEIVGEIQDEYDDESLTAETASDGSVLVSGTLSIADANDWFATHYPVFTIPEDGEYETVAGFANKIFGKIPEQGEKMTYKSAHISVTKKHGRRVAQIRIAATA